MDFLRYYLLGFKMVSGLHINFAKCNLYGISSPINLEVVADMLGCKTESIPSSYLGFPL